MCELLKHFIGLRADDGSTCELEGRHGGDAQLPTALPIGGNSRPRPRITQGPTGSIRVEIDAVGNLYKSVYISQIRVLDKIRHEKCLVDCLSPVALHSPAGQLLRSATVVGHAAISVLQSLRAHKFRHLLLHLLNIDIPASEQLLQTLAFVGGLQMQWVVGDTKGQGEFFEESFNTDRAEIAPGSYVVGEHLQDDGILRRHCSIIGLWSIVRIRQGADSQGGSPFSLS